VSHNDVHSFHRQGVEDINETYIGHKLKSLRIEHGLKQSELADALCVSTSTISHWEKGRRIPSLVEIGRIADHFGVAMRTLIEPSDMIMDDRRSSFFRKRVGMSPSIRRIGRGQVFLLSMSALLLVLGNCSGPVLGTVFVVFGASGLCYVLCFRLVRGLGSLLKGTETAHDTSAGSLTSSVAKDGTDPGKVRISVLSLSTMGGAFLMLALVFHVIALLHDRTFVTSPLVMSLAGFILVWIRINVPEALDKTHPFVGRVHFGDDRLVKGQRLLLVAIALDLLSSVAVFITSGDHKAFVSETPWAWITVLCVTLALIFDITALYVNQRFLDGFHPDEGHHTKGDDD
jgi:transcriptional regulator with XRE-family HTH domain